KTLVKYLREKLVDQNEIRVLPNKSHIENILKTILSKNKDKNVINAQKFDLTKNEWKSLEWKIYPEHLKEPGKPPKKFVYRYDLLNNDLLLNELQNHEKCSLSPPDFDEITPYYENLCMDGRYTFRELLNSYIQNEITMALYGQELLKSFLKNKVHQMMEKLYAECIRTNIKSEKDNFWQTLNY
ncbi:16306_t:CDS:2, partial [Gigaspora margarita]